MQLGSGIRVLAICAALGVLPGTVLAAGGAENQGTLDSTAVASPGRESYVTQDAAPVEPSVQQNYVAPSAAPMGLGMSPRTLPKVAVQPRPAARYPVIIGIQY